MSKIILANVIKQLASKAMCKVLNCLDSEKNVVLLHCCYYYKLYHYKLIFLKL